MSTPRRTGSGPNTNGGLCHCGCEQPTSLAPHSHAAKGWVKGKPIRYIYGHQSHAKIRPETEFVVEDRGHTTPCWIAQRVGGTQGYGAITRSGKRWPAHVWQWQQVHGPVPADMELDHLCRVRPCCNPEHVEPVTHLENVRRGDATILTVADVHEIRRRGREALAGKKRRPDGFTRALAQEYGVGHAHIKRILSGKVWSDLPGAEIARPAFLVAIDAAEELGPAAGEDAAA